MNYIILRGIEQLERENINKIPCVIAGCQAAPPQPPSHLSRVSSPPRVQVGCFVAHCFRVSQSSAIVAH